ncbi:MAG: hypothetical protein HETSPECPRED_000487 [Heterodermia speciosa]|uniref:WW domain-containing protein n=1 Tax=Heterodermia speciosa TaxID=116794 RepID=A0A8H3IX35_9LECA|nr:MAG: hypothetical protein HETSPECPRED_000487 [Heterodermia speciosa]
MSFLNKYKKQFDDAKNKYIPSETQKPDSHPSPQPPAAPTESLTPAVPPGWAAQWDPTAARWTYTDSSTGKTQSEHPDPANYGGQSMPPGGPVLEKDGKPKKDEKGMLIGAAGGLATGAFGKMLIGKAKKKALKQAGMGGHSKHGGGHGGHGGHGGGEGSGSSSSGSDSD